MRYELYQVTIFWGGEGRLYLRTSDAISIDHITFETSSQEIQYCFTRWSSSDTDHFNAIPKQFAELLQDFALDRPVQLLPI